MIIQYPENQSLKNRDTGIMNLFLSLFFLDCSIYFIIIIPIFTLGRFRFYFINSILIVLHLNEVKIEINTKKLDECVFHYNITSS